MFKRPRGAQCIGRVPHGRHVLCGCLNNDGARRIDAPGPKRGHKQYTSLEGKTRVTANPQRTRLSQGGAPVCHSWRPIVPAADAPKGLAHHDSLPPHAQYSRRHTRPPNLVNRAAPLNRCSGSTRGRPRSAPPTASAEGRGRRTKNSAVTHCRTRESLSPAAAGRGAVGDNEERGNCIPYSCRTNILRFLPTWGTSRASPRNGTKEAQSTMNSQESKNGATPLAHLHFRGGSSTGGAEQRSRTHARTGHGVGRQTTAQRGRTMRKSGTRMPPTMTAPPRA